MANSWNDKQCVDKSESETDGNAEGKPRRPVMSITTVIVICTVVPLLLSGFFNHFAHKNWILYFPVFGIALAVIYFGHVGIQLLNKSNVEAPKERPYVIITDSRLERAIAAGDYPTFYFTVKNGALAVKGTIRNITVYFCATQEKVFPYG